MDARLAEEPQEARCGLLGEVAEPVMVNVGKISGVQGWMAQPNYRAQPLAAATG